MFWNFGCGVVFCGPAHFTYLEGPPGYKLGKNGFNKDGSGCRFHKCSYGSLSLNSITGLIQGIIDGSIIGAIKGILGG